ncbi:MAG TPA: serine/threonine-protein kinase [Kofleriaceae bacterium]
MEEAAQRQLGPGTMLDEKYRIDGLIAVGGMGAVYHGTHTQLRKRVAIKVLNPQLNSPIMIERFKREAITASQIGHEGIAQVTDIGTSYDGEPFLVMELLEGESLATRCKRIGAMPIDIACELACSILAPLGAAHAAGVVHRDLKPDNVYLVRQSRGEMIKLLDFGISRSAGGDGEFRLTTTGLVLGTPYYMSPEQARGDTNITPAADIYALGVIMYELMIGAVPISAENYNQLMYRVMVGEFVRPRQIRPDIPEALEQLILTTMALDPAQRPANADALERALLPFCRPTFREHTLERLSHPRLITSNETSLTEGFNREEVATSRTMLATPNGLSGVSPIASRLEPAPARMTPTKQKSKAPMFILLGVVAVIAAGIGVAVAVGGKGHKPSQHDEVVATAPPKVETAPPKVETPETKPAVVATPPAPTKIAIKFDIEPATAKLELDGKAIEGTELSVDKDDKKHSLVITADGYEKREEQIAFDENQKLGFELSKVAPKSVKASKAGKTGKIPKTGKNDRIDSTSPYQ